MRQYKFKLEDTFDRFGDRELEVTASKGFKTVIKIESDQALVRYWLNMNDLIEMRDFFNDIIKIKEKQK